MGPVTAEAAAVICVNSTGCFNKSSVIIFFIKMVKLISRTNGDMRTIPV